MVKAWHGHGVARVNQTRPHCVNQMGKTHSKPLAARHGRGSAWARHGNGMLCVNRPLDVCFCRPVSVCLISSAHSFDFAPVLYYFCLPFGSTSSCGLYFTFHGNNRQARFVEFRLVASFAANCWNHQLSVSLL